MSFNIGVCGGSDRIALTDIKHSTDYRNYFNQNNWEKWCFDWQQKTERFIWNKNKISVLFQWSIEIWLRLITSTIYRRLNYFISYGSPIELRQPNDFNVKHYRLCVYENVVLVRCCQLYVIFAFSLTLCLRFLSVCFVVSHEHRVILIGE